MPVLIPPLPPKTVEIHSIENIEETSLSQGLEGRQVRDAIKIVCQHWRQQSLAALVIGPSELLDELSQYQHPPFEHVGKLRVRFAITTDLKPRTFVFDEEEE